MKLLIYALALAAIFTAGVMLGVAQQENTYVTETVVALNSASIETASFNDQSELPSPKDRISNSQVRVYDNQVVLDIRDAEWAIFTDTNSMDPVLDAGAAAIEIVPQSPSDIQVGDIISYQSVYAENPIIHRVIAVGQDNNGWYARLKGDNNQKEDPEKVRFGQVQRVVVAIIY